MSARQFGSDSSTAVSIQPVNIRVDGGILDGDLVIPAGANGLVVFAHGSGSSRRSPRNQYVAQVLQSSHSATLLFDLLTPDEEEEDAESGHLRFNISWLAERLITVTRWASLAKATKAMRLGYFGSSTGAAAALVAAASLGKTIDAVVSRGGRPDLAAEALPRVHAPTLLIVGGADALVLQLNRQAYARLHCPKELAVVPGASHLFEEEGALEKVAHLAARWFHEHWKTASANT
jgi:dienelactone hydrolase